MSACLDGAVVYCAAALCRLLSTAAILFSAAVVLPRRCTDCCLRVSVCVCVCVCECGPARCRSALTSLSLPGAVCALSLPLVARGDGKLQRPDGGTQVALAGRLHNSTEHSIAQQSRAQQNRDGIARIEQTAQQQHRPSHQQLERPAAQICEPHNIVPRWQPTCCPETATALPCAT